MRGMVIPTKFLPKLRKGWGTRIVLWVSFQSWKASHVSTLAPFLKVDIAGGRRARFMTIGLSEQASKIKIHHCLLCPLIGWDLW